MSRKPNVINQQTAGSHFGGSGTAPAPTLAALNSHLPGNQRITADVIDIFSISPDPAQPRRILPSDLGRYSDYASMEDVFGALVNAAAVDLPDVRDVLVAIVNGDGDTEALVVNNNPALQALIELAALAASIRRDGLTNPITVINLGNKRYQLETGERRWLAYHLLYQMLPDAKWRHIPARVMSELDVWRQAAENNARADLSAIGRARQYAILMMALHPDRPFTPYDQCASDQAFYAQALDLRVPRGKGDMLLSAMGLTARSMLSDYREVLQLPPEAWNMADDQRWSLGRALNKQKDMFDAPNITRQQQPERPAARDIWNPPLADPRVKKRFAATFRRVQSDDIARIKDADLDAIEQWVKMVRAARSK